MRRIPDLLRVRAGDEVLASHVRELNALIEERTYIAGHNVRARVVPGFGVYFEAEEQFANWSHPWSVTLEGDRARVSPGLLNGVWMPRVRDRGVLRALDGLDDKGVADPLGPPTLKLSAREFGADGYSWIVLRVKINPATGRLIAAKDGGVTLEQSAEMTWHNGGAEDVESTGDCPLAMLRRAVADSASLGKLTQVAMFHLNHRFVAAKTGPGTHFFWV